MNSEERREQLLIELKNAKEPKSGTELAKILKVSRQVVVQDIALLRAVNKNIMATNKGYILFEAKEDTKVRRTFPVCHSDAQIVDELNAIVDCGGRVRDVVVEHEQYGQIMVDLIINNRQDVINFVKMSEKSKSKPLNVLTDGMHFHTVEADSEENLDRVEEKLKELGLLSKM